jgi:uncharacterized protein
MPLEPGRGNPARKPMMTPLRSPRQTALSTPCTKVCVIDHATGLCRGCLRSLDEIAGWSRMDEPERLAIMARLPDRAPLLVDPA